MLITLRDDRVLETSKSHEHPPDWAEWIDVANDEYQFCDDNGQRYRGVLLQQGSFFRAEKIGLEPIGEPKIANALELVDAASAIDSESCEFPDLDSLRQFLTNRPR